MDTPERTMATTTNMGAGGADAGAAAGTNVAAVMGGALGTIMAQAFWRARATRR